MWSAGYCGTGAIYYGDESSVLDGLLFDAADAVYTDDYWRLRQEEIRERGDRLSAGYHT